MEQEAARFADARPQASWSPGIKIDIQDSIHQSFIDVFNMISYVSAALCFAGAIISWFFIKGKPKKIQLE